MEFGMPPQIFVNRIRFRAPHSARPKSARCRRIPRERLRVRQRGDRAQSILKSEIVWDAHSGFMPDPAADLNNLRNWLDARVDYPTALPLSPI